MNWKEVQEKYLHTIGKLTLTAYNSELSDRPFIEKRNLEGGFADSPLKLNRGLSKLETWNEKLIQERTKLLYGKVTEVCDYPELSPGLLEKYKEEKTNKIKKEFYITDFKYLSEGKTLELFQEIRERITHFDDSIKEEFTKLYVAYKTKKGTNFVDIVPQKDKLKIFLNIKYEEIDNSRGICRAVTNIGRWGNGDVEVLLDNRNNMDYVVDLIEQSFDLQ